MEEKFIVAIEIGSSKIKGALGKTDGSGALNVLAVREEQAPDCVRYGHIRNIEEVSNRIDEIIAKLNNSKAISPRKINGVYVGISGATVNSTLEEAEITFQSEQEISTDEVNHLIDMISSRISADRDIYEVLPVKYVVDKMTTSSPVGHMANGAVQGTFTMISGAKGLRSNINRVFRDRLNLDIKDYILAPTAIADTILTAEEKIHGCVMVDFGAETTTVCIYKRGALNYLVTLPMGSRNITRDLETLDYLEERAEKIKQSQGVNSDDDRQDTSADTIEFTKIANCISARCGEIIANISAQIEYAGFKTGDLSSGFIITGGGSRMKGFSDLLSGRTKMKARVGILPVDISISDSSVMSSQDIDVIALLRVASKNPIDCIEAPENHKRNGITDINDFYGNESDGEEQYVDELRGTRIGKEDSDDPLDDDYGHRIKGTGKKPKPVDDATRKPSLAERIRERLSRIVRDNNDDRFDEDDE